MDRAIHLLRYSRVIDRAYSAFTIARDETALALLSDERRQAATSACYEANPNYTFGSAHTERGLFEFEVEAIERFFPPPPARVLVAACGAGREVRALACRGFRIAGAYDAVPAFVESTRALGEPAPEDIRLWVARHEDLDRVTTPELGRIDAVIVGWISYTHILGRGRRVRFLRALRRIGPHAPVLLSFYGPPPDPVDSPRARLRRRLRDLLSRLPQSGERESGDGFLPGVGFVHFFARSELESEASDAGYELALYSDGGVSPHAVLVP